MCFEIFSGYSLKYGHVCWLIKENEGIVVSSWNTIFHCEIICFYPSSVALDVPTYQPTQFFIHGELYIQKPPRKIALYR
jgi:hypothetical protein